MVTTAETELGISLDESITINDSSCSGMSSLTMETDTHSLSVCPGWKVRVEESNKKSCITINGRQQRFVKDTQCMA